MAFRYDFLISDLLFRVECQKELRVPENFQPFLTASDSLRCPDILLEIVFYTPDMAHAPAFEELTAGAVEKIHWKDGADIIRCEPAGRGQPCRLFVPSGFETDFRDHGRWLLYFAIERMLLPFRRIVLHASAVIYQGNAYLFSAPSGGGKSTHAALWETYCGATVLNGDKVIVEVGPNGCRAYGSPVAGSSGIYRSDSAPVGAVFFLHKGKTNRVEPLSPRQRILALYSESIKSSWDRSYNSQLLEQIQKLQDCVPVLSLECLPDRTAAECALRYIEGTKE